MITPHFHSSLHRPDLNAKVGQFVSRVIWGDDRGFSPFCSMAVVEGGELIAGVIYHSTNEDTGVIELSAGATSRRWMKPNVLKMMMDIPFHLLGCQMVLQRVSGANAHLLPQMRRFGYSEYVIPRMAGRGVNGHVFTMTDDQWANHWLAKRAKLE